MRTLPIVALLAVVGASAQKPTAVERFSARAAEHGIAFAPPPGFVDVAVRANRDMEYDFALRDKARKLEIRYALRPFSAKQAAEYAAFQHSPPPAPRGMPPPIMLDPNEIYATELVAVALNVAGGGDAQEPQHFPSQAVKEEFGADDGLVTHINGLRSAFGKGFKQCTMFVIHKRGVGDAYVFFLFDDPKVFSSMLPAAFHSLGFAR